MAFIIQCLTYLAILASLFLGFFFVPLYLYVTLVTSVGCYAYYQKRRRRRVVVGRKRRTGLGIFAAFRRWLPGGFGFRLDSLRRRSAFSRAELQAAQGEFARATAELRQPISYTPNDCRSGFYAHKLENTLRSSQRKTKEQLGYVWTRSGKMIPFYDETPLRVQGRFSVITKRQYPVQQPRISPAGVLPAVNLANTQKKVLLTPRSRVKLYNPHTLRLPNSTFHYKSLEEMTTPTKTPDPCSRDEVLKALRESRKRVSDMSLSNVGQEKKRRNDSGESSQSSSISMQVNGSPPRPKSGSTNKGMTSSSEDVTLKRSLTSSTSSNTAQPAFKRSITGSRNAILSSYSSTMGFTKYAVSSTSSILSSPASSRSETPDAVSKRPRDEDMQPPSSTSSSKSERSPFENFPALLQSTPVAKMPTVPPESGGSRKRKVQLLSSTRSDSFFLPLHPELGFPVTTKDLDEEKIASIKKIRKVLETPEAEQKTLPAATVTSQPATTTTATLSSLLAAPLRISTSSITPVINLDPSPSNRTNTASAGSNSSMRDLNLKSSETSLPSTPAVTTSKQPITITNVPPSASLADTATKTQSSAFLEVLGQVTSPPSSTSITTPSTVSSTVSVTATSTPSFSAGLNNPPLTALFKPVFPVTSTTSSTKASAREPIFKNVVASTQTPPLATTSPPAFAQPLVTTTTSTAFVQPPTPTITSTALAQPPPTTTSTAIAQPPPTTIAQPPPPAATSTARAMSPTTSTATSFPISSSVFGAATSSTTNSTSGFPSLSNTGVSTVTATQSTTTTTEKSFFGFLSKQTTTSSISAPMQSANTSQFSTAATSTSLASTPAVAPATSSSFMFSSPQPSQDLTMASTAPATTSHEFPFKVPAVETTTTTNSTFSSSAVPSTSFSFSGNATSTTPSNPIPGPSLFNFGTKLAAAATTTTSDTFGKGSNPAFGASSAGFSFGAGKSSSAAPSSAPQGFGTSTQSSSSFSFGGAPQQQTGLPQSSSGTGFGFGNVIPTSQFGSPVPNNPAPQMGNFGFGGSPADKPPFGSPKPTFGQGTSATPSPFGSPATPAFNPAPFGAQTTPTFSIGAAPKPTGSRHRLQARRQHRRK